MESDKRPQTILVVNRLPDIPSALNFVAGREIMEIDRRPLEITRAFPPPSPHPINAAPASLAL